MNIFKQLSKLFFAENKEGKIIRYISILGLIGIFLLILSSNITRENNNFNNKENKIGVEKNMEYAAENNSYADKLENDLQEILSVMKDVGKAQVKIILERESAYEFKYNINNSKKTTSETDSNGGKREITQEDIEKNIVILKNSDGSEEPLIKVEKKPIIKGVLVAAEGASNPQIEYKLTKAVSNFFDIPLYKVNILPLQGR